MRGAQGSCFCTAVHLRQAYTFNSLPKGNASAHLPSAA